MHQISLDHILHISFLSSAQIKAEGSIRSCSKIESYPESERYIHWNNPFFICGVTTSTSVIYNELGIQWPINSGLVGSCTFVALRNISAEVLLLWVVLRSRVYGGY